MLYRKIQPFIEDYLKSDSKKVLVPDIETNATMLYDFIYNQE